MFRGDYVAWTTSRLTLYEYLEKLGSRVLYCDTDSCIYVSRESKYEPHMGNFLRYDERTRELRTGQF